MATLQVLDKEPALNPNAGNQFVQGMQLYQDVQYKRSVIRQQAEQLKLDAKKATTEEERVQAEAEASQAATLDKKLGHIQDIATKKSPQGQLYVDQNIWGKGISTLLTMYPKDAKYLGELSKSTPQPIPEQQQGQMYAGQGAEHQAYADFLKSQTPGATGNVETPVNPATPNQAQVNNIAGNTPTIAGNTPTPPTNQSQWMPTTIGPGGVQFENMGIARGQAEARNAAMKTDASGRATKAIEMEPIRSSVENYLKTFDAAVNEMGGLETNALAALGKGKIAQITAQLGDKPNTFTLSKLIEPVSLQLGSWLNKGRPTDKDQAAARDTLTRLTYTKGANEILRNYLKKIIDTGDEATGWTVWNALRTGNTKLFTEGSNATSNFIIRKK